MGHIGENNVKHHMRTKDTTKICFIYIELGHLSKNYMNRARVKDEKKN